MIPQNRERIYIVFYREEKFRDLFDFTLPILDPIPKLHELMEPEVHPSYYYNDSLKVYESIKEGVKKPITDEVIYQFRRYYVRENSSGHCPTLTANMGEGGHNVPLILDSKGIRKLTPRECFNLQGFPQTYKFPPSLSDNKLYKLAGNAVSVPIVMEIASRIVNALLILDGKKEEF